MIRLCLLTTALAWLVVFSSSHPAHAYDQELGEVLAAICDKHNIPSLTVAAFRTDEMRTSACSGVRKRGTNDAVAMSDRHPIGSCTKSMTATLAAVLVEAGKLQWNMTIGDAWPKATEKNLHPALRNVTLNDLLAHRSGLPSDLSGAAWASFFEEKKSPSQQRRRMLNLLLNSKPEHTYGKHNYSNLGYVVAAAMMEKVTGNSYEGLMRRYVFKPLGMESADFRTLEIAQKLTPPLIWGHMQDGTAIDPRSAGAENPSVYAPCGTVNLTIADYVKYAQWHLKQKPTPLLKKQATVDHLHTGHVEIPALGGEYGCGWILLRRPLGKALHHGGSNTNSQALIWLFPEKDFGAIALTNTGEGSGFLASDEAIGKLIIKYAH